MRLIVAALAWLVIMAAALPATAGPGRGDDQARRRAQVLLTEGVRLLEARDYQGALDMFRAAQQMFPSAKILLNISTTYREWGKHAEAANSYQRYLDAPDADPRQVAKVRVALGRLDARVGVVEIQASPVEAEIQIDNGEWRPAATVKRWRVLPGRHTVTARVQGSITAPAVVELAAGDRTRVVLRVERTAAPRPLPPGPPGSPPPQGPPDPTWTASSSQLASAAPAQRTAALAIPPESLRTDDAGSGESMGIVASGDLPSRHIFGVGVRVAVDPANRGAAVGAGLLLAVTDHFELAAGGLIGAHYGGYVGATAYLLDGSVRPLLSVSAPMFWTTDRLLVAARGAIGLEWRATEHLGLLAEVGVERFHDVEPGTVGTVVVPVLGIHGRL